MKRLATIVFLMTLVCATFAQKQDIRGAVIDRETGEPAIGSTLQLLLLPDSSFVAGAATDADGFFLLKGVQKKKYALKITSIGYINKVVQVDFTSKKQPADLGFIELIPDTRMLDEVEITANAAKVQVSGDSIVYNASAYRVPEGSTLEALVKLLPGAKVDDDGNITVNGKTVSKILVDGKEFFLNDKNIAMKNIPTEMIEKIKTYEKKSDLARITGIDDGAEETVLDLSVKKEMKHGWFGNATYGQGTKERYNGRGMVNRFNDQAQVSLVGNARNTPNRWGWNNGLRSFQDIGLNFSNVTTKLEVGGNVRYRHEGSDVVNESSSENFVAERGAFSNSYNQNLNSDGSVGGDMKIEWKPDTMTNILFRPNANYSRSHGYGTNTSGSYDVDPNITPLDELIGLTVNTNQSNSQSFNTNVRFGGELQINRKFNNRGRNLTFRFTGNYNEGRNKSISAAHVTYNTLGQDKYNNRFFETPSQNYNVSGQVTYNEPVADRAYLQFSYKAEKGYNKNDRRAYVYDSDAYQNLTTSIEDNRYDIDAILRFMESMQYEMRDSARLSRFSEYSNFNQTISLQFQHVRESHNLNIGVDAFPQHTTLNYEYMGQVFPKVKRSVFNISPRLFMKWNFSKHTNLRIRYNGRTGQPSMVNMLEITDDADPLNIRKGNSNLKPSFTSNLNANFNTYNPEAQRSIWAWSYVNIMNNNISDKTTYDKETGVRTTMPMNINGNWNSGGGVGMNTGLGEKKLFFVGGDLGTGYGHNVGYYNNKKVDEDDNQDIRSLTKNLSLSATVNGGYRSGKFNAELRCGAWWAHATNAVNPNANQNILDFQCGGNMQWTMPWGTELATDIKMAGRRGYSIKEMNTNELLWNASLSHSFLRGKALTLKAEMFDILGQQTNLSRWVNAMMRNDSRNNTIYQYALFSVIFRFSVFGGKNVMGTDKERQ